MGQTELVRRLQLDGVPMTRETLAKIERGVRPNPRRLKVFCPAFLQKSGRGPGAAPLAARRSARNALCAKEAQEGVKGGTLAGGSPFAGGPRRPQPLRTVVTPVVNERRAGVEPRPYSEGCAGRRRTAWRRYIIRT